MKKLLSITAVLAILATACIMGIGTVAFAAQESSPDDFLVYDGVLEEYVGEGGDVVIPASLGVKEIAERAFSNNETITSLVIPEGVETIGGFAFYYCKNIESLTLPYSLMFVNQHCFTGLESLTEVVIPGNCEIVSYGMFCNCPNLTDVTLSYGIKEIHVLAFQGTGMGKVIFPETVELICGGSFSNNKNPQLTTIEYYICNPDCELGWEVEGYEKCVKHQWARQISVWNDNVGDPTYKIFVPEDSEVYKLLKEKGDDMLHDSGSGKNDTQRIIAKEKSFFSEMEENQKGYGKQKPTSTGTNTDGDNDVQNPVDGNTNKTDNKTNAPGDGIQGGTNTVVQQGESNNTALIVIVCIFGGIMLLAIIVVIILAATGKLFGGKKAEKPEEPEDEETAALKAEIAAAKKEKEIAALKAELAEIRGENSNNENE